MIGGIANTISINIGTYTIQRSKAMNIALLRFLGVIYAFLVDLLFFKETFTPMQIIAVVLILSNNIAVSIYKVKNEAALKAKAAQTKSEVEISEEGLLPGNPT